MKYLILMSAVLMVGLSSRSFASSLSSQCETCPLELHVHLVGGTLSLFAKKTGFIKPVTSGSSFDDALTDLAAFYTANPEAPTPTSIEYDRVISTGRALDYSMKNGELELPNGSILKVTGHKYYFLNEAEALYQFTLEADTGEEFRLLGDVTDPTGSPVFWGVIVDRNLKAYYSVSIQGRTSIAAERALMQLERFFLDTSVLPPQ